MIITIDEKYFPAFARCGKASPVLYHLLMHCQNLMWKGRYHANIAQNILGWQTSSSSGFAFLFANQAIIATSMNGFTKLVRTSPMKNSRNLTSEKGENKAFTVPVIIGNLITLWKYGKGSKNMIKNKTIRMYAKKWGSGST